VSTPYNYFNYFTEIEEYFWQKRGAALIRPPLEWELIETWQHQGIPLEAVRKGIDRAFESYTRSRRRTPLKSLLYCNDAVLEAAEEMREAAAGRIREPTPSAFAEEEIAGYLRGNAILLRRASDRVGELHLAQTFRELAAAVDSLASHLSSLASGLEELERHLTVFEEKLLAAIQQASATEELIELRREVDRGLAPYRHKMRAEQLVLLEKQFQQKKLFERYGVPRLSLFYLPAGVGLPAAVGLPAQTPGGTRSEAANFARGDAPGATSKKEQS
jgi:hypothetical protein